MDLSQLIETVSEVSPDESFAAVVALMSERQVVAVIQDRKVFGIIAEADVAHHTAIPEVERAALRARDVMTRPVETMPISTPVIDAAHAMRSRRLQYLALVDERGDFVGMVTLRQVLLEVMDELDLKVDNLERELMADGPGG